MRLPRALGIWRHVNNLRLREKMIVTFLLFGFLPMLLVSLIMQNAVIEDLKRETERASVLALEQMTQRIDERIGMYNIIADGIVLDHQLIRLLNDSYGDLGEAIELYHYVWNLRASILRTNPEIRSVALYTAQPDLVSAPPYLFRLGSLEDISDYARIQGAQFTPYLAASRSLSGEGDYWMGAGGAGRVFSLNRVITQPNAMSRAIGVATLMIDESALRAFIQTNTEHSMTMIVDQQGRVVSAEWGGAEEAEDVVGRMVYSMVPREVWLGQRDARYTDARRGEMQLITRDLKWGWKIATVLSVDGLQARARDTQRKGILVVSACAAAAVALVALVSAKTAGRVKLLLDKFSVASGASLRPGEPIGGADEIGLLDSKFREMAGQLNLAIHDLYAVELQKKETLLIALQARINPHFLYNTLSDIGWMTQTHAPEEVRRAIEMLVAYYRASLSGGRDVVTLKEELTSLNAYLAIQRLRMGRRVQATVLTDPMLEGIRLPKMTLQPIVENSIEHGVTNEHPSVSITITSEVAGGDVLLNVTDDGPGFDEEALALLRAGSLAASGGGYGMKNVQMRLRLSFGEAYGLSFENLTGGGARTTVRIPLRED